MMRRDQNGIIVLRIERISSKMALYILLLVLSIFLTNHSIAKERNPTMDILLVPVGEVDRKVIEVLQNELSRVFNKPVMIGKGMSEPDYAFNQKRNQYLSTAILNTIMEQKEYASFAINTDTQTIMDCTILGNPISSKYEWDALIKTYMEE